MTKPLFKENILSFNQVKGWIENTCEEKREAEVATEALLIYKYDLIKALKLLKKEINKSIMNWSSSQVLNEIDKCFPAFKEK